MAGNFRSGRPRTRERIEDARRVDALEFCRANDLPTVQRETPGGELFELGTCPKCEQPRRDLFATDAGTVCRRCAGLSYRSSSESNSVAQIVRRDAEKATGEALETMQNAVETGNAVELDKSAHVLEIAATTTPTTASSATSSDAAPDFLARVQEGVIRDDLAVSSVLLERIAAQLLSGEETRVDKRGNVDKIPLRPDATARLVGAFVSLSNLRANRAGVATQIYAQQDTRPDSLREIILRRLSEDDRQTPEGASLRAILNAQNGTSSEEGSAKNENTSPTREPS